MTNIKEELRRIIRRYYQAGSPERIRKEIKKYLEKKFSNNLESEFIEKLRKEVEKEFEREYIKNNTAASRYLEEARNIIRSASRHTEKIKDDIAKRIFDAIEEGINGNLSWREVAANSIKELNVPNIRLKTEIETHQAALDRLSRVKDYNDDDLIEYAGPTGTVRPFCVDHIGKIYTVREAKQLKNMFNQPALYFCGGYNCRHRWDLVKGEIEDNQNGRIFKQSGYKQTEGKELEIARYRLAQLPKSSTIQLLSKVNEKGVKSFDALENGEKTEYKRITDKSLNLSNTMQRVLREGKEQAGRIVVLLEKDLINIEYLNRGIKRAKYWDKNRKIKKIILLNRNGKEIVL